MSDFSSAGLFVSADIVFTQTEGVSGVTTLAPVTLWCQYITDRWSVANCFTHTEICRRLALRYNIFHHQLFTSLWFILKMEILSFSLAACEETAGWICPLTHFLWQNIIFFPLHCCQKQPKENCTDNFRSSNQYMSVRDRGGIKIKLYPQLTPTTSRI